MNYLCRIVRLLPLLLCIFTPIIIFLTYGVAVGKDHVAPLWPYISDTGTKPPESCIFGLLLSSVAFLLYIIIYIRYREVSEYAKLYPSVGISRFWNRVAACLGYSSAFGLHIVASFQEINEFITHIVGALLCFFSATFYFLIQTIFTRKMQPEAKCMLWIRIVFTFLNVLFIVGTFAPTSAALTSFTGDDIEDMLKWTSKDGGYEYHLISSFSEWFLVFSFCAYVCTLFWDFRKIEIEPLQIKFTSLEGGIETEAIDEAGETNTKTVWI